MIFGLLGVLLSIWSLGLTTIVLGAVIALALFRGWTRVAMIVGIVLAAHLGAGYVYQSGRAEERGIWVAKAEAEQLRQRQAIERAATVETMLAEERAEKDRLRTELESSNEAEILAEAAAEAARVEAERLKANAALPPNCPKIPPATSAVCTDSKSDVDRLRGLLR